METWDERERAMTNFGLDHILTISEQSVNTTFSSMWNDAAKGGADTILHSWNSYGFHASFSPCKVRLLSSGKAVVWINLEQGETTVIR